MVWLKMGLKILQLTMLKKVIDQLQDFDINITEICIELLSQGCTAFDEAFESLLDAIEKKATELIAK